MPVEAGLKAWDVSAVFHHAIAKSGKSASGPGTATRDTLLLRYAG